MRANVNAIDDSSHKVNGMPEVGQSNTTRVVKNKYNIFITT